MNIWQFDFWEFPQRVHTWRSVSCMCFTSHFARRCDSGQEKRQESFYPYCISYFFPRTVGHLQRCCNLRQWRGFLRNHTSQVFGAKGPPLVSIEQKCAVFREMTVVLPQKELNAFFRLPLEGPPSFCNPCTRWGYKSNWNPLKNAWFKPSTVWLEDDFNHTYFAEHYFLGVKAPSKDRWNRLVAPEKHP